VPPAASSGAPGDGVALWQAALALPLWSSALFAGASVAAWLGARAIPLLSGDLALLLLPTLLLPGLFARRARLLPLQVWWCAAALALLALQAAISCAHPPRPPGAWRHFLVRALVVVMALAVASAPIAFEPALAALAWSGALACAAYLGLEAPTLLAHGWLLNDDLRSGNIVFGNVSWVVNTLAPALILGLYLALGADSPGSQPGSHISSSARRWRWPLIAALVAVLAFGIIGGRQGAAAMPSPWWLAAALALGIAGLCWLTRARSSGPAAAWAMLGHATAAWLLALVALCSGRRGFLAFLIVLLLWFAYDAVRHRFPRAAWAGMIALLGAALAGAAALLLSADGTDGVGGGELRHNDRVIMARAALEAAASHPWFGQGDAGTLRITLEPGRFAGYSHWFGVNLGHSHDEALELLVSAGAIGLALTALLVAWLVRRVGQLADHRRRQALAILLIGMAIPALSDPSWSRPFAACSFGAAVGVMLKAIAAEGGEAAQAAGRRAAAAVTAVSWLVVGGASAIAVAGAALALFMAPAAAVVAGPFASADLQVLIARSCDVGTIVRCGNSLLRTAQAAHDGDAARATVAAVETAIGPASWGPERYTTLVALSRSPEERAAECVAGISIYPFESALYEALENERRSHPKLALRIPPRIAARLQAYFSTLAAEPAFMAAAPLTIDDAADQYAVLSGRTLTGTATPAHVDQVERLVVRYRRMPCMSALAFRSAVLCPPAMAAELLSRMPAWRCTAIDAASLAAILASPFSAPQAARVASFLAIMYPAESAQADALIRAGASCELARASLAYVVWAFLRQHPAAPAP
jgi:hypothetical protein